jgi:TfoX/Sxy family transcriptional regulator of competence genes
VPYDEDLADRIRELLPSGEHVTEKKMFGGLCFLIGGHMAVAASGQGGLLVRCAPEESERLVAKTSAAPMIMRGREMRGWLRVEDNAVRTKRQLTRWVEIGAAQARSLPPKR